MMFIKDSEFKKMVNKAFKKNDLIVARHQGYYFIGFGWCNIQVTTEMMSNKIKAILVEMIGDLPQEGEGYLYGEGCDPQSRMDLFDNIFEEHERYASSECEATCLMVRHCGDIHSVLQVAGENKKIMVHNKFIEMVSTKPVETDNGETVPGLPVFTGRLVWANNIMALSVPVTPIKYRTDKIILSIEDNLAIDPFDDLISG